MDKKQYYNKVKNIIMAKPGTQALIREVLEYRLDELMKEFDASPDDNIQPNITKGGRREIKKLLKDFSKDPLELGALADGR